MKSKIFFALFFILLIGFAGAVASIGITVTPTQNEYAIGEDIAIAVVSTNKGDKPMDIRFEVSGFSALDPSINIFQTSLGPGFVVGVGASPTINYTNIDTTGLDPGVYTFTAVITDAVSTVFPFDSDIILSDNTDSASVVLVRAAPTAVPEIPRFFIIFIVLAVLFIVHKN